MTRPFLLTTAILMLASAIVNGQKAKPATDNYDTVVAHYLETARQMNTVAAANDQAGWINSLMGDRRARNVNDLVTVRVIESISATGSADANVAKKGGAQAGVTNLFGAEKYLPGSLDPTRLVGAGTETKFNGGGSTTRRGDLSAVITSRVAEVLPNGDLVLEGIREVEINGDRQIIVLTGVARPQDIGQGNVLLSPSIGQLRIRYFGKGLMKDSLSPGWLVRFVNKIF